MNSTQPQTDTSPLGVPRRDAAQRIFLLALVPRVIVCLLIVVFADAINEISRDSSCYDRNGRFVAQDYARGEIDWSQWIDEGWNQFIGVVYYFFGPHLIVIMLINAALAAWAAVLTYRIGRSVFQSESVGWLAASIIALFPSIIYYTSMPLKEAAAMFALLSVVWGVVLVTIEHQSKGALWIVVGMAIVASLRFYLFLVGLGCLAICLVPYRLWPGWKGVIQIALVLVTLAGGAFAVVKLSGVDISQHAALHYFDIDYVNKIRVKLTSHGKSRMFDDASDAVYGESLEGDIRNAATGLYYFLFSVDVTDIRRNRQLAAAPEMLFFLLCLPYLYRGLIDSWQTAPRRTLPILLFSVVLVAVYGSTATNMGALYRWRVQALPYVMLVIAYGASRRKKGILHAPLRWLEARVASPADHAPAW